MNGMCNMFYFGWFLNIQVVGFNCWVMARAIKHVFQIKLVCCWYHGSNFLFFCCMENLWGHPRFGTHVTSFVEQRCSLLDDLYKYKYTLYIYIRIYVIYVLSMLYAL